MTPGVAALGQEAVDRIVKTMRRACARGRARSRQYSSVSMIVMTRRVTAGWDGSGEW
jgi:hypothetical protein